MQFPTRTRRLAPDSALQGSPAPGQNKWSGKISDLVPGGLAEARHVPFSLPGCGLFMLSAQPVQQMTQDHASRLPEGWVGLGWRMGGCGAQAGYWGLRCFHQTIDVLRPWRCCEPAGQVSGAVAQTDSDGDPTAWMELVAGPARRSGGSPGPATSVSGRGTSPAAIVDCAHFGVASCPLAIRSGVGQRAALRRLRTTMWDCGC